jgi:hypothetical protein
MPRKVKEKYNEYMKSYMINRYNKKKEKIFDMLGGCCAKCGSKDNLEIDHIDPSEKSFSVSKMWSIREDLFIDEIGKCQLLCHKHHLEKTLNDNGFNSRENHGTYVCYRYNNCRCEKCRKIASIENKKFRDQRKNKDR